MTEIIELVYAVKQTAMETIRAEKLCDVMFGEVVSASPLSIAIDQKLILGENQLILSRLVTDYEAEIEISTEAEWQTEKTAEHTHSIKGKKKVKFLNSLKTGEKVILLRITGGQSYLVLDREGDFK